VRNAVDLVYCPGCASLLDVETNVPSVEGGKVEPIWDIAVSAESVYGAAARADRVAVAAAE